MGMRLDVGLYIDVLEMITCSHECFGQTLTQVFRDILPGIRTKFLIKAGLRLKSHYQRRAIDGS